MLEARIAASNFRLRRLRCLGSASAFSSNIPWWASAPCWPWKGADRLTTLKAFVFLIGGAQGCEQTSECCRIWSEATFSHKYPRFVPCLDQLPKTGSGKIDLPPLLRTLPHDPPALAARTIHGIRTLSKITGSGQTVGWRPKCPPCGLIQASFGASPLARRR